MRIGSPAGESGVQNDWTEVYSEWHDQAVAQGKKVTEIMMAIHREEPRSLLVNALNEIVTELQLHRAMFGAIRMGIARGHLMGAE